MALVNVDFAKPLGIVSPMEDVMFAHLKHFSEIQNQLIKKQGLNYAFREQRSDSRIYEHASETKVLIDHLTKLTDRKDQ